MAPAPLWWSSSVWSASRWRWLALLVNHDDAEREYAYRSDAATFGSAEPITDTATRLGWTQVSMRDDWSTIFPGGLTNLRADGRGTSWRAVHPDRRAVTGGRGTPSCTGSGSRCVAGL